MADHWLTKAGRRWSGLVAGSVSLIGVVGFAATARHYWAWVAIVALFLLAVSFALTARDEQKLRIRAEASDPSPQFLQRAIEDGHALTGMDDLRVVWEAHHRWHNRVYDGLETHEGLAYADGFAKAAGTAVPLNDTHAVAAAQVKYLESLR